MTKIGCAAAVTVFTLCGIVTARGQADAGKQAFSDAGCVMCHGPRGRGADGPALVPMDRTYDGLARIVREGIGEMPGLADDVVTDEQIDLVHRYLTELSGGAAPGGR